MAELITDLIGLESGKAQDFGETSTASGTSDTSKQSQNTQLSLL
jgi:hypothetical protein